MRFIVIAALSLAVCCTSYGQNEPKKQKKGKAAENAEALKKMAAARGDIQFHGRTIRQAQFKKMAKHAAAEQLGSLKQGQAFVLVGMPVSRQSDSWIIATKRTSQGWNAGQVTVNGEFKGKFVDGELAAVYGEQTRIGDDWGFRAYLVDKPSGDDLGLVFQYKVLGQNATVGDQVQTWTVVGEVYNSGNRDFAYVEIEARMDSAGDSDVWSDFIRVLPAKSKKPFSIKLIGLQLSSLGGVSQPRITVYIKDFAE